MIAEFEGNSSKEGRRRKKELLQAIASRLKVCKTWHADINLVTIEVGPGDYFRSFAPTETIEVRITMRGIIDRAKKKKVGK